MGSYARLRQGVVVERAAHRRCPATGALSSDFEAQVAQSYINLGAALEALSATPANVVKVSVFVVDHNMSKLGLLTKYVTGMFGSTLPAQTLVPVPKLAIDGMLFEVEAVVALS